MLNVTLLGAGVGVPSETTANELIDPDDERCQRKMRHKHNDRINEAQTFCGELPGEILIDRNTAAAVKQHIIRAYLQRIVENIVDGDYDKRKQYDRDKGTENIQPFELFITGDEQEYADREHRSMEEERIERTESPERIEIESVAVHYADRAV